MQEDIRINKTSWKSQSRTHKLKWIVFFIFNYEFCFSACRHLPHHYFFYFLLSLRVYIQIRHDSSDFLLCCFLISSKPTASFFNSLLIPGDQTKKWSVVMAAYLPGADTGGEDAGDEPPTRPKDVLTWHLISLKLIAKNIFVLHIA